MMNYEIKYHIDQIQIIKNCLVEVHKKNQKIKEKENKLIRLQVIYLN